jgi:hypothetical protein
MDFMVAIVSNTMINIKALIIAILLLGKPVAVSVSNNDQTRPAANVYVKAERRNRMAFSTGHDFVNVSELVVYKLLNFIQ